MHDQSERVNVQFPQEAWPNAQSLIFHDDQLNRAFEKRLGYASGYKVSTIGLPFRLSCQDSPPTTGIA